MSGAKLDVRTDVIKDPDIVEASESTIENLDPILLDGNNSTKKAYIRHNLSEPDAKGLWPELLPEVLWAYRTRPKTSTCEMPYSLVYDTDAVIPIEVGEPSPRYSNESGSSNDESRLQDLDEVEERRDMAHIRMVDQKQAERYYTKKAKVRPLRVGDYILKAN
uniref:Uncharacterized protein n=2 Tax=Nicotiana TaxID=4085 RepID=A0A1S3XB99_TOBAC|nr:PREDICTED: uncharacterized protein LOC104239670 [Nicotiana sylvestris]XP_016437033.1 PREDICTED: uncharacterized protein LOC107763109 [Nicotiana tabacum]